MDTSNNGQNSIPVCRLREALDTYDPDAKIALVFPPPELCTGDFFVEDGKCAPDILAFQTMQ